MIGKSILIVGATSAIARHAARALLPAYQHFVLAARNHPQLAEFAAQLSSLGAGSVQTLGYDAAHDINRDLIAEAKELLGELPDTVLIAHGLLPTDEESWRMIETIENVFRTNTISVFALCAQVSRHFEHRGHGMLAVISSVAADRGRMSNFLYAASKAALDVFLDGLRLQWQSRSPALHVLTIKPGFVRTPMTAHLRRTPLAVSAERVGTSIARLILLQSSGRRYIPWWWRPIMTIVANLPDWVLRQVKV